MTTPPPTDTGYWCDNCDVIVDELIPVYECSLCGGRDSDRRCHSCNRFAARDRDGHGCPDCFTVVTEIEMVEDHDGEWIPHDQYQPDGESLAARSAVEAAARESAAENRRTSAESELMKRVVTIDAHQLRPGHLLVVEDFRGDIDTLHQPTVLSVSELGRDHVVITVDRYRSAFLMVNRKDQQCQVLTEPIPEEPEPMWTVGWNPSRTSGFSPSNRLEVGLTSITVDSIDIPAVAVYAVMGNHYVLIAATHLTDHAIAVGDAFIDAGRQLASANGDAVPAPTQPEPLSSGFRPEFPSRHITMLMAMPSEWSPSAAVEIISDRQSSTIGSPQQLVSAGAELIRLSPRLLHSKG